MEDWVGSVDEERNTCDNVLCRMLRAWRREIVAASKASLRLV